MKVEASITGKRQITIPKDLYSEMGLKNIDKLVFSKNKNGEIVVSKKELNTLDVCPICNREVLSEDTMVVEKSQKYHMSCWDISKEVVLDNTKFIANKINRSQLKTLEKIEKVKKETELEIMKNLKDGEVIIRVPVKITFMESKPGVVGMVSDFSSKKIFNCNEGVDL